MPKGLLRVPTLLCFLLGGSVFTAHAQTTVTTSTALQVSLEGSDGQRFLKLDGTVSSNHGVVSNGQITFTINGSDLSPVQVPGLHPATGHSTGRAERWINLPSGTYRVAARFTGTLSWASSISETQVISIPALGSAAFSVDGAAYTLRARDNLSQFNQESLRDEVTQQLDSTDHLLTSGAPKIQTLKEDFYLGSVPSAMTITDLSGKGMQDLVISNYAQGTVSIYPHNASGLWLPNAQTIPVGVGPTSLIATDLNGDGLTDLAVANAGSNTISILLQDGMQPGIFLPSSAISVGSIPVAVVAGDINEDGFPDLAVANFADNTISILLNDPNRPGSFNNGALLQTQGGPSAMALRDLTNAGHLDLAVTSYFESAVSVYIGTPTASQLFTNPTNVYRVGAGPTALLAADLNGDGLDDLVVCNSLDGTLSFLPAIPSAAGQFPTDFLISGFDYPDALALVPSQAASQSPDLLVSDGGSGILTILKNDGKGLFNERNVYSLGSALGGVLPVFNDNTGAFQVATFDPNLQDIHVLSSLWSENGKIEKTSAGLPKWKKDLPSTMQQATTAPSQAGFGSSPQQQEIDFAALGTTHYGVEQLALTATTVSGHPVQFRVMKGPAILTSPGVLKVTGAGDVVVRAEQVGKPVGHIDRTLHVLPADITIEPFPAERSRGKSNPIFSGRIKGLVGSDTLRVQYTSAATPQTPAGVYKERPLGISPHVLSSPSLSNYEVHASVATLTICAPLKTPHKAAKDVPDSPSASADSSRRTPVCSQSSSGSNPYLNVWSSPPQQPSTGGLTLASGQQIPPVPVDGSAGSSAPTVAPPQTSTSNSGTEPTNLDNPKPIGAPVRLHSPNSVGGLTLSPVLNPGLPHLPVLPLPSVSIGRNNSTKVAALPIISDQPKILLLEDQHAPHSEGGVTLLLQLRCSNATKAQQTVLLAQASSIIATLEVTPNQDFLIYVPFLDATPAEFSAFLPGGATCSAERSPTLILSPPVRRPASVENSDILLQISSTDQNSYGLPDTSSSNVELNVLSLFGELLNMQACPTVKGSFVDGHHPRFEEPNSCIKIFPKLPIKQVCPGSLLPPSSL